MSDGHCAVTEFCNSKYLNKDFFMYMWEWILMLLILIYK